MSGTTKIPCIAVDLERWQTLSLASVFDQLREQPKDKRGMVLAHVSEGRIRVFLTTQEQAHEIQRIMGTRVGKTNKDDAP